MRLARESTNQPGERIFGSIGLAIPEDPNQHGYVSEHHGLNQTEETARAYAEELAYEMLTTALEVPVYAGIQPGGLVPSSSASGLVLNRGKGNGESADMRMGIRRNSIAQSAVGNIDGYWTTVVAAVVFAD